MEPLWSNEYFSKMWLRVTIPQYTTQFEQTNVDEIKLTKTRMLKKTPQFFTLSQLDKLQKYKGCNVHKFGYV